LVLRIDSSALLPGTREASFKPPKKVSKIYIHYFIVNVNYNL